MKMLFSISAQIVLTPFLKDILVDEHSNTLSHLVFMLRALYVVFRYFTPKFKNRTRSCSVQRSQCKCDLRTTPGRDFGSLLSIFQNISPKISAPMK